MKNRCFSYRLTAARVCRCFRSSTALQCELVRGWSFRLRWPELWLCCFANVEKKSFWTVLAFDVFFPPYFGAFQRDEQVFPVSFKGFNIGIWGTAATPRNYMPSCFRQHCGMKLPHAEHMEERETRLVGDGCAVCQKNQNCQKGAPFGGILDEMEVGHQAEKDA